MSRSEGRAISHHSNQICASESHFSASEGPPDRIQLRGPGTSTWQPVLLSSLHSRPSQPWTQSTGAPPALKQEQNPLPTVLQKHFPYL